MYHLKIQCSDYRVSDDNDEQPWREHVMHLIMYAFIAFIDGPQSPVEDGTVKSVKFMDGGRKLLVKHTVKKKPATESNLQQIQSDQGDIRNYYRQLDCACCVLLCGQGNYLITLFRCVDFRKSAGSL